MQYKFLLSSFILAIALGCGHDQDRLVGTSGGVSAFDTQSNASTDSDNLPDVEVTPVVTPEPNEIACDSSVEVQLIEGKRLGLWQGSSTQQIEVSAKVVASTAGVYEFYTAPFADGGASQLNESFYTRVFNDINLLGFPLATPEKPAANCGSDYVVVDIDNVNPATDPTYIGTFELVAGDANVITFYHFCGRFYDSQGQECADLHQGPLDGPTSCLVCGGNNLEVIPSGLCIKKRPISST